MQLALACMHLTSDVSLQGVFRVDGLDWVQLTDVRHGYDHANRVNALDFSNMFGMVSDGAVGLSRPDERPDRRGSFEGAKLVPKTSSSHRTLCQETAAVIQHALKQ